jgi:Putative GTPase activating protein for Arf
VHENRVETRHLVVLPLTPLIFVSFSQYSSVRSLTMDHWSHEQVLAMLEGGNEQLDSFFRRHAMSDMLGKRYKTKAARFYREHLGKHVSTVKDLGVYQGREAFRRPSRQQLNHSETM